ncbi:hypothetical protein P280DRAFT_474410 [Massarina eburnea CBS 473.64]|uniref:F-box domain-containing protein n=1 Tax=Massarina eburnea CBS 473.64 TaxID=1395130 RepID=A0A6A6RI81_9PLEO|nr:hypothetical protein P280DRAFT_474410 [Massarina eburnea CBS 473.64]
MLRLLKLILGRPKPEKRFLTGEDAIKFAKGWNSLPDELKVIILDYALDAPDELDMKNGLIWCSLRQFMNTIDEELMALLACPATADLSIELFYKRIEIDITPNRYPRNVLHQQFVHRLTLDVQLEKPELRGIQFLRCLGDTFPNVRFAKIRMEESRLPLATYQTYCVELRNNPPIMFNMDSLLVHYMGRRQGDDDLMALVEEKIRHVNGALEKNEHSANGNLRSGCLTYNWPKVEEQEEEEE